MKGLLFGTAGIPLSVKGLGTAEGISQVGKLGLSAMELEFVHSVNISREKVPEVKKAAESNGIALTCHAPYFINYNTPEKAKIEASIDRVYRSCDITNRCGGWSVVFHPGFYLKDSPTDAYKHVKSALEETVEKLKADKNPIWVRPETMGKGSQIGTLEEVLQLSEELEQVMPCIDYSHMHARQGKYNSYDEFCKILDAIEKSLGKKGLENMHIQCQAVEYTEKGERRHLEFNDPKADFKYEEVCRSWKDYNVKGVVICESPNIEGDAMLLKKTYDGL